MSDRNVSFAIWKGKKNLNIKFHHLIWHHNLRAGVCLRSKRGRRKPQGPRNTIVSDRVSRTWRAFRNTIVSDHVSGTFKSTKRSELLKHRQTNTLPPIITTCGADLSTGAIYF